MKLLKKILIALLRWAIAAVLLFISVALVVSLTRLPVPLGDRQAVVPLAAGFGTGILLFALGWKFLTVYVFGHELTHWLAAKCFGRRTGAFSVGGGGGSVEVENPNVWIVLAPYFVPIYALIWLGLWGIVRLFVKAPGDWLVMTVYAGTGLTYAFHVLLTVYALMRGQNDLVHYGKVLSLSLILFCNVALVFAAATVVGGHWKRAPETVHDQLTVQWRVARRTTRRVARVLKRWR